MLDSKLVRLRYAWYYRIKSPSGPSSALAALGTPQPSFRTLNAVEPRLTYPNLYLCSLGPPGEPWLDPKYLPPEPQPMGSEGTPQTTSGGLYITPGVLIHNQAAQKAAGGRDRMQGELLAGGKKSVGGGLKPTLLTSSY